MAAQILENLLQFDQFKLVKGDEEKNKNDSNENKQEFTITQNGSDDLSDIAQTRLIYNFIDVHCEDILGVYLWKTFDNG